MDEEVRKHIPLRRFGRPDEIADVAAFLMSPMADWITGEVVTIDGGEWLHVGQEFGGFTDHPRDAVKQLLSAMKPKRDAS
jgi:hypothetical protein